jgi:hypothetical protein
MATKAKKKGSKPRKVRLPKESHMDPRATITPTTEVVKNPTPGELFASVVLYFDRNMEIPFIEILEQVEKSDLNEAWEKMADAFAASTKFQKNYMPPLPTVQ